MLLSQIKYTFLLFFSPITKYFPFASYIGTFILSVGIITFAFSTILGWSYYGEKAVEYLGGKDNIISTESKLSRFIVTLKDTSRVDKESIQKLGAKGIVEINNQLKIILGPESKQLKKYIDELK